MRDSHLDSNRPHLWQSRTGGWTPHLSCVSRSSKRGSEPKLDTKRSTSSRICQQAKHTGRKALVRGGKAGEQAGGQAGRQVGEWEPIEWAGLHSGRSCKRIALDTVSQPGGAGCSTKQNIVGAAKATTMAGRTVRYCGGVGRGVLRRCRRSAWCASSAARASSSAMRPDSSGPPVADSPQGKQQHKGAPVRC
jgi:hypothetical protein